MMGFGGFGSFFSLFEIMFFLVFFLILALFIVQAVRGLSQWNKNNHSPRLTVPATVVAKRQEVHRHHHNGAGNMHHTTTSTTYYVTFQVASGDRMELQIAGDRFGYVVEGDSGQLTFQGTRFLDFVRQ